MSGFGIRALKKVKEESQNKDKRSYFKYIVLGESAAALLTFYHLEKKYPGEVRLITRNPYGLDELKTEWKSELSAIRSEVAAETLKTLSSHFEVLAENRDVLFYKDAKFHKFGGRAKPHELKEQELFFAKDFYHIKREALLLGVDLEKDYTGFFFNRIIENVEIVEPSDLVEITNFRLHSGEHEVFECEKLYFCESPKTFFSLVSNKDSLNDSIHKFCAGLEHHSAIAVSFTADKKVSELSGTAIIPQSLTHDWGSFVCDFDPYDEELQSQSFKALTYISENEVQEEDLARKIKLMRRVLERVYPELAKASCEQNIRYSEEYTISGIDDSLWSELRKENVCFIGHGAAIDGTDTQGIQYFVRTALSLYQQVINL